LIEPGAEAERQLAAAERVAGLVPAGLDRSEIADTAAGVRAMAHLNELTREILDHALDEGAGAPAPVPAGDPA
jgi:hypothetical protein